MNKYQFEFRKSYKHQCKAFLYFLILVGCSIWCWKTDASTWKFVLLVLCFSAYFPISGLLRKNPILAGTNEVFILRTGIYKEAKISWKDIKTIFYCDETRYTPDDSYRVRKLIITSYQGEKTTIDILCLSESIAFIYSTIYRLQPQIYWLGLPKSMQKERLILQQEVEREIMLSKLDLVLRNMIAEQKK